MINNLEMGYSIKKNKTNTTKVPTIILCLTPIQQHGTHSPSIPAASVCLHQGKLESGLKQGQTYSTQDLL